MMNGLVTKFHRWSALSTFFLCLLAPSTAQAGVSDFVQRCIHLIRSAAFGLASPTEAVALHLRMTARDPRKVNVYEVQVLSRAAGELAELIGSREELAALRPQMEKARVGGVLPYREFLTLFFETARALTPGESRNFEIALKHIDVLLDAGVIVLPVVQDTPMKKVDLMKYRAAFIYPYQLVSKPTKADGSMKSPWDFLYHDHLHSALMFTKDLNDGLIRHLNGLQPAARQRWLQQRASTFDSLWAGLERLQTRERTVVVDVLFEVLHEWPPERENSALIALRNLNRIGLTPLSDVRRGLREQRGAAAQYLVRRLLDTRADEIENALVWIEGSLR